MHKYYSDMIVSNNTFLDQIRAVACHGYGIVNDIKPESNAEEIGL